MARIVLIDFDRPVTDHVAQELAFEGLIRRSSNLTFERRVVRPRSWPAAGAHLLQAAVINRYPKTQVVACIPAGAEDRPVLYGRIGSTTHLLTVNEGSVLGCIGPFLTELRHLRNTTGYLQPSTGSGLVGYVEDLFTGAFFRDRSRTRRSYRLAEAVDRERLIPLRPEVSQVVAVENDRLTLYLDEPAVRILKAGERYQLEICGRDHRQMTYHRGTDQLPITETELVLTPLGVGDPGGLFELSTVRPGSRPTLPVLFNHPDTGTRVSITPC